MANLDIIVRVKGDGSVELKKITDTAKQAEASTKSLTTSTGALSSAYSSLRTAIAGLAIGVMVKETIQMADTYKSMSGRLALVTKNTQELTTAQTELFKISQETRQSYEETTGLYTNLATSMQQMGKSQKDILATTETVNKAIAISGSTTQQASAAIMQLGQAFASGTLRGDELNSIMENSKGLAQAIASGMGVPIGKLRELGAEGKITSQILADALAKSADEISGKFEKMPMTVGQSITMVQNSLLDLIGTTDSQTGATDDLSLAFKSLATTISENKVEIVEWGKDTVRVFETVGMGAIQAGTGISQFFVGIPYALTLAVDTMTVKLSNAINDLLKDTEGAYNKVGGLFGAEKANLGRVDIGTNFSKDYKESYDALQEVLDTASGAQSKLFKDLIGNTTVLKKTSSPYGSGGGSGGSGGGGKGPTKAEINARLREEAQLKRENLEIDNKIFALTHSESEIRLREIDQQATAYREAKISEIKVNDFVTQSKKAITDKSKQETIDAQLELDEISKETLKRQEKETQTATDARLTAQTELYKEINQMNGDFYANELIRIDEVAEASRKAGVDEIKILEYKKIATKQAYDNMGLGIIKASEVAQNAVKGLEDALVSAFTTGKFEADKMFEAIFADIARMTIRQSVTGPISSMVASMFASANGNAFVGGQSVTAFANGGAFTNKVVSSPTVAPMALFGEAGPEAIMPLTRTSDGKLGVATTGGQSQQNIKVEIINESGEEMKATTSSTRFDGEQFVLSVVIDAIRRNKGGMRDIMGGR